MCETYFAFNDNDATTEVNSDASWMLQDGCTELTHEGTVTSEYLNLPRHTSSRQ